MAADGEPGVFVEEVWFGDGDVPGGIGKELQVVDGGQFDQRDAASGLGVNDLDPKEVGVRAGLCRESRGGQGQHRKQCQQPHPQE